MTEKERVQWAISVLNLANRTQNAEAGSFTYSRSSNEDGCKWCVCRIKGETYSYGNICREVDHISKWGNVSDTIHLIIDITYDVMTQGYYPYVPPEKDVVF